MTDISKCEGTNCPLAQTCWRYQAPSGEWQNYINPPWDGKHCIMYMKMDIPPEPEEPVISGK